MRYIAQNSARVFAVASFLLLSFGVAPDRANAQSTDASSTITAQLCAGGLHAPSGSITSPVSGTIVGEPTQQLSITTSWVRSYELYSDDGLLVQNSSVAYDANVTTAATVTLPKGTSTLALTLHGGCPAVTTNAPSITLTYSLESATIKATETNSRSPRLQGFVSRSDANVRIFLNARSFSAQNNGDGTWTLPANTITPDLPDGSYDVRVVSSVEGENISDTLTRDAITIDTVTPSATISTTKSDLRSPELHGTIDDPRATLSAIINGQTYAAQNNGDGTWTLPRDTIKPLASGTYDITIVITDQAGNSTAYTKQLHISAPDELGFILSPNTGFLRVHTVNVPSWALYGAALAGILGASALVYRKLSMRTQNK